MIYYFAYPKSYERAFHYYELAAKKGDSQAQNALGYMYSNAEGVKKIDNEEAAKYYLRAAKQGNNNAHIHLGCLYAEKKVASKTAKDAIKHFKEAEKNGSKEVKDRARLELGRLYNGEYGEEFKDYTKAEKYFQLTKAADGKNKGSSHK